MSQGIGEAAGKVWSYLHGNGAASVSSIVKGTGLPRGQAERALGWLAREDKIAIEKVKQSEKIRVL